MTHLGICITDVDLLPSRGATGTPLATLSEGERLDVSERDGEWCRVSCEPGEGFVPTASVAMVDPERADAFLASDPAFLDAEVEPPADARLEDPGAGRASAVARAWNLYGGLLGRLAERTGIDPAAAVAVVCVESSGHGFGPDGRVIIRFENHIFRRYLGASRRAEFDRHFRLGDRQPWLDHRYRRSPRGRWRAFHGSQALEWDALEVARSLDEGAALRSISMGLPQVMGFNHALVGYADPAHLLAFMAADVRFHLLALFDFIRGGEERSRAVATLQGKDFDAFAALYNGPGQARYYGDLIESHVAAFRSLQPAGPQPTLEEAAVDTDHLRAGDSEATSYVVRPGDTLGAIAGRFGVTVAGIAAASGVDNPNLIRVGQRLTIPRGKPLPPPEPVPSAPPVEVDDAGRPQAVETYVVRPGDTLGRIAREVGRSLPVLAEANGIEDVNLIFPGQVLAIPPA